ncbi:MAG: class I SAM-dependent methyltransferase [Chloroflexi bacterium]|nr:class I SAM-dependent methyltransferase [Chloroflexota bacterium]
MADLKSFDRVAHLYDETRGVPAEAEQRIGDGLAALLRGSTGSPHLLEVGIGTGRIAVPLAERGVRVTGIDISTKMLAILRGKRTDIDVMIAEASRPPLRDRSFDAALFVHVLHLVPDPEATIRATIGLVRAGGFMIEAGDDREQSLRSQADELIRSTVEELSGVDIGGWAPYARGAQLFTEIVRDAGGEMQTALLASWTSSTTGQRMLERLKRRDYSSSWKIPDAAMPALLERVTPRIAEMFGGLDRTIEYSRSFSMRFARLPD